jgi:hypothetical protein
VHNKREESEIGSDIPKKKQRKREENSGKARHKVGS